MEQPRPTPTGAVHRPDGTTNITSLHRTLKKKIYIQNGYLVLKEIQTYLLPLHVISSSHSICYFYTKLKVRKWLQLYMYNLS